MEDNQNQNMGEVPDPDEVRERYPIEDDADTLEPFDDQSEHREINADDPKDLAYWAAQFQIDVNSLKGAIALNGNSIREIKKYLSV
ncbi:DUF3606 domain-containing protein [Pedobacter sp. BMA]|uniref:DUF3606 domain-containing protein n=1 Tax=Pedobacter sp. BMA TaxID=1663685 RepID=UPI00064B2E8F|nr:DUF3606 domain-containing protein [Pedobacter sp. BMA]KLT63592.1 hypothetical protein AB669_20985 [Pedobacter sp. BMA]